MDAGTATVTSPAPARSAPRAASAGAPAIPGEPPITSTRPTLALCAEEDRAWSAGSVAARRSILATRPSYRRRAAARAIHERRGEGEESGPVDAPRPPMDRPRAPRRGDDGVFLRHVEEPRRGRRGRAHGRSTSLARGRGAAGAASAHESPGRRPGARPALGALPAPLRAPGKRALPKPRERVEDVAREARLRVLGREPRRQRPGDADLVVVEAQRELVGRVVRRGHLVLDLGPVARRLEAVGEALGDPALERVLRGEHDADPAQERRRAAPHVDGHVEA